MHEQKAFAAWSREGFLAFCGFLPTRPLGLIGQKRVSQTALWPRGCVPLLPFFRLAVLIVDVQGTSEIAMQRLELSICYYLYPNSLRLG